MIKLTFLEEGKLVTHVVRLTCPMLLSPTHTWKLSLHSFQIHLEILSGRILCYISQSALKVYFGAPFTFVHLRTGLAGLPRVLGQFQAVIAGDPHTFHYVSSFLLPELLGAGTPLSTLSPASVI